MRYHWSMKPGAALLFLACIASPSWAQDDAGAEADKAFGFFVELDAWQAEPVGLEYEPATRTAPGSVISDVIDFSQDDKTDGYYRVGFQLAPEVGEFVFSWYSQSQQNLLSERVGGSFVFGELLAYPVFAGYLNDGLADGFLAIANTAVSDLRFDYRRLAFRSDRITGRWFVGVRRVTHDRQLLAEYYALSPNPPTVPPTSVPRPDLTPLPDEAMLSSNFIGRGIESGMDFHVPLGGKRFKFETGFALAILRGKVNSAYFSTNYYYTVLVDDEPVLAAPPYTYFGDPSTNPGGGLVVDYVEQEAASIGLASQNRSTVSPVIDLYLGLRAGIYKGLELVAGYRSTYYGDVGVDLRPKVFTYTPGGVSYVDVTEVDRSVQYHGVYLGVSYTY